MGNKKLAGTSADILGSAPDAGAGIAPALVAFLRALHTFPTDRAVELGAPAFTPRAWMDRHVALFVNARAVSEPRLPLDAFARFVTDWEQMLADRAQLDFEPMLIHGDLAMEHLLVDADGDLSGVIDFGDAMVADPALDVAGFPDELAQSVLALYTNDATTRDGIWRRGVMYRRAAPLHAIAAGVELKRDDLLLSGIDALRQVYG